MRCSRRGAPAHSVDWTVAPLGSVAGHCGATCESSVTLDAVALTGTAVTVVKVGPMHPKNMRVMYLRRSRAAGGARGSARRRGMRTAGGAGAPHCTLAVVVPGPQLASRARTGPATKAGTHHVSGNAWVVLRLRKPYCERREWAKARVRGG